MHALVVFPIRRWVGPFQGLVDPGVNLPVLTCMSGLELLPPRAGERASKEIGDIDVQFPLCLARNQETRLLESQLLVPEVVHADEVCIHDPNFPVR